MGGAREESCEGGLKVILSEKTVVNYVIRWDFLESTCFFKVIVDERDEWMMVCVDRIQNFIQQTLFVAFDQLLLPTHLTPTHSTPNILSWELRRIPA